MSGGVRAQVERPHQPEAASGRSERSLVRAREYIVSAAHPLAAEAGARVLAAGGTAIDAAIATQLVLNVVEPQSSGIGGGAYLLYYDASTRETRAYDARETAPAGATPNLFLRADGKPMGFFEAVASGRSVGVPGVMRLLGVAHRRHGKLSWASLFEPAIALAENGYALSARTRELLSRAQGIARDPGARALFFDEAGELKAAGTLVRNPALAATLRLLAREGADAFYRGEIARDIAAAVRNHPVPGTLSEADLAGYGVRELAPLCAPYRRYRVCGMPPSSSGGIALLQMLGMLSTFDLGAVRPVSSEAVHLLSEAGRLAFADRNRYVADDRFVDVPITGLLEPQYLRSRAQLIRPEKSMVRAQPGIPHGAAVEVAEDNAGRSTGTSHFAIVDRSGNAVSFTTSIEAFFGSRIMTRGFFLNNQLTDFSFSPSQDGRPIANRVAPGKRPRSSMAPTLVFDGDDRLYAVLGSAGGSLIINYVLKTLVAALDWKLDIQSAIDLPNVGSRNEATELERGTPAETLAATLQSMGHPIRISDMTSGTHGLMRMGDEWTGGVDPRRDGAARGR